MLERALDNTVTRAVSYTNARYLVDPQLRIIDTLKGEIVTSDSDGIVEVTILGCTRKLHRTWLIAMAFKPMFKAETFMFDWIVQLVDGDPSNDAPENLVWTPPKGGSPCPELEGFFVVPGSTRIAVSRDGRVASRAYLWRGGPTIPKAAELKVRVSKDDGYVRCSSYHDVEGKESTTVHRLMALALLPYPANVDSLTVNHRDGIKHNNVIDNLEWNTYSENNTHALDTGLRNTRTPVRVFDYWTGAEHSFTSVTAAAEQLNVNSGYMYELAQSDGQRLLGFRYAVKYITSGTPWLPKIPEDLKAQKQKWELIKESKACIAIKLGDVISSTVGECPSHLASLLGLTRHQVETFLESKSKFPHFGYFFGWLHEGKEPPQFEPDEVEAFKPFATVNTAYRVYLTDGTTRVVIGVKSLGEFWPGVKAGAIAINLPKEGAVYERDGIRVVRL